MHTVNRTVVVTGASSGIGKAIAEKLLDEGHTVIGIARNFSKFQPDNQRFHPQSIDLADLETLPSQLTALIRTFPSIDGVICNAGRGQFGSLEEFSYTQIHSLMDLNFTSHAYLTRAVLPMLKRRKQGDIIFIGSEAALKGSRKGSLYCASKFALRGFSQALREECSRSYIKVSLINPGMVQSEFFNQLNFRPGSQPEQHILPSDIAQVVSFVLSSRVGTVMDEINLTPLHDVIDFN